MEELMNILTVKGNRIDNGVLYYPILNNTQTLIVSLANFEKNLKTTNKEKPPRADRKAKTRAI